MIAGLCLRCPFRNWWSLLLMCSRTFPARQLRWANSKAGKPRWSICAIIRTLEPRPASGLELLRHDLQHPSAGDIRHVKLSRRILSEGADVEAGTGYKCAIERIRGALRQAPDFAAEV